VLLIRGTAEVELVEGIPDGYLTAGRKVMTDDKYVEWVAGVQSLYDEMVVITITPTWAKLLDFETTIPKAVEDLIKEKGPADAVLVRPRLVTQALVAVNR
jgi:hypothetical protein